MLPFADVMNLLTDEFTSLCRWRLAFPCILSCSFDGLLFRHEFLVVFCVPCARSMIALRLSSAICMSRTLFGCFGEVIVGFLPLE